MRRSRKALLKPQLVDRVLRAPGVFKPNHLARVMDFRRADALTAIRELVEDGTLVLADGFLHPREPARH